MNAIQKTWIINIISSTNKEMEEWADKYSRYGKLQLLSHPTTSVSHLVSKIIREAHDGELFLREDCWFKLNQQFPGIPRDFYDKIFHDLIEQIYFNLKSDLYNSKL